MKCASCEQNQIDSGFAEAEYLRHSQSTIFLCQSAAGGGCVGRLWRDDAALRMGRLRAAALRVLTEERIFRNCILAGLRSAGSHCENNLILTSGSIPYLRFDFSCEEQVYHLLSPKGGAKSVRQAKTSGNGRRLAPETLRGQARAPVFDRAFSQGGSCGALRATIKRMSPFIVCAARNHDHLVAFRFGRPAIFRRDGGCLPDQVKTHPLFRIGCAERGAILPVRVPEVVKTIYFLKKRARLFFNSQNYSIFALDFAE